MHNVYIRQNLHVTWSQTVIQGVKDIALTGEVTETNVQGRGQSPNQCRGSIGQRITEALEIHESSTLIATLLITLFVCNPPLSYLHPEGLAQNI